MHLAHFKRATRDFLRSLMSFRLFEAFMCSPAVPGFLFPRKIKGKYLMSN